MTPIAELKRQTIRGPSILCHSGNYFNFENPEDSNYTMDDIAHGLSMTCRFSGQSNFFYSVAEHSVYVSQLVPPELALDALMYDAAEAFICDMPKPLKEMLPDYQAIEKKVEFAIAEKFGLRWPMPREIKLADIQMLRAEQKQVMGNDNAWTWNEDVKDPDVYILGLNPGQAKAAFLRRLGEIKK